MRQRLLYAAEWRTESAELWLEAENAEPHLLDVVGDGEEKVDPRLHLGFDGCAVQLVETFLGDGGGQKEDRRATEHNDTKPLQPSCPDAASHPHCKLGKPTHRFAQGN